MLPGSTLSISRSSATDDASGIIKRVQINSTHRCLKEAGLS